MADAKIEKYGNVNKNIKAVQENFDKMPSVFDNDQMMKLMNMSIDIMQRTLRSAKTTKKEKQSIAKDIVLKAINKDLTITHDVGNNFLDFVKQANKIAKDRKKDV